MSSSPYSGVEGLSRFVTVKQLAMAAPVTGELRIGAFSRRVGVSPAVLRAWEARYGLFTPRRTSGGFRLYSPEDESRVRRMLAHLAEGVAPRESAALVLGAPAPDALAV